MMAVWFARGGTGWVMEKRSNIYSKSKSRGSMSKQVTGYFLGDVIVCDFPYKVSFK